MMVCCVQNNEDRLRLEVLMGRLGTGLSGSERLKQNASGSFVKGLDGKIPQRVGGKLKYLGAAHDLRDLTIPPSNQLAAPKGDRLVGRTRQAATVRHLGSRRQGDLETFSRLDRYAPRRSVVTGRSGSSGRRHNCGTCDQSVIDTQLTSPRLIAALTVAERAQFSSLLTECS